MTMNYYEFEKNKSNMIRVTPRTYEGHDVMDVRTYARNKSGEWVPTPKGISINVDRVPDLIHGLEWSLQQPCTESDCDPVESLTKVEEDELAETAHSLLKEHGVEVHWDMAEEIVLSAPMMGKFSKWQLHCILTTRRNLFEYRGDGCFKAV